MTHSEMASTIRNRVSDALSGAIADQSFSIEQLMSEIDLVRADLIDKREKVAKIDIKYLVQKIGNIPIKMRNMSEDCLIKEPCGELPSIKIPRIVPTFEDEAIQWLGTMNMQENFIVYYDPEDIKHHKIKRRTRHLPYAWVDLAPNKDNTMTIWFMNWGKFNPLKFMRVRAIFEHPTKAEILDPELYDKDYPAPAYLQNAIINDLTEKYIRYFRQLNIPNPNNTQSDQVT